MDLKCLAVLSIEIRMHTLILIQMSLRSKGREFTPLESDYLHSSTDYTKKKILNQILTKNQDQCSFYKMVLNTKVNGTLRLTNVMEEAIRYGQTAASTRDIGRKIKPMAVED